MKLLPLLAALLSFAAFTGSASAATATIASGENRDGTIAAGTSDNWTFSVTTNDSILLRLARRSSTDNYTPNLRLYAPDGLLVGENANSSDAAVSHRATQTGTYTAVVNGYYADSAGAYRVRMLKIPATLTTIPAGDDGGPLTSGQNHDGTIDLGDLDPWTFNAATNDVLLFRLGKTGAGNLTPHLRLYGPDGALLAEHVNSTDAGIPYTVTQPGIHTLVVSGYYGGDSGTYRLRAVKLPGSVITPSGDQGGPLTSGQNHDGTIDLGDIDAWTVNAALNDTFLLRLGRLSGSLTPRLTLYSPDGVLISDNANSTDTGVTHTATKAGNYTVIVTGYYSGDTGTYRLHYLKSSGPAIIPAGDQGGPLTSGLNHEGTIATADMDPWTITASTNDRLFLRLGRVAGTNQITPYLRLYAPDGTLVAEEANTNTASITHRATQSGTYLAVASSYYSGETGTYLLRSLKSPGTITTSPGDEGGILTNGQIVNGSLPIGDLDAWIIAANSGTPVSISLTKQSAATNLTPYLAVYDSTGNEVAANASNQSAVVNFTPATSGLFTVVAQGYYTDDNGPYQLAISGVTTPLPPAITAQPAAQSVAPGATATLSVAATGSAPLKYQWLRAGLPVDGATGPSLSLPNAQPATAGLYSVEVSNLVGSVASASTVVGIQLQTKVAGAAYEFAANIVHPSGNVYDQILLTGSTATVTADPGQIVRTSYVDLNDDIVQVEFSGAGSLTIALASATGPAVATKYNQPSVQYMKGHASLTLIGANETTHLSVFTVGSITAVNQALFKPTETYDGVADLALLAVTSPTGRLGSIRFANTELFDAAGLTGIHAPGVRVGGPVNLHNLTAIATATPVLLTGTIDTGRIGITGGDMLQLNARPIQVGDAQAIVMLAGSTSHGVPQPAQTNKGVYEKNGVNVTATLIQNP